MEDNTTVQIEHIVKRIDYIDALKGFAIFSVVFAHVIAWSYTDLEFFKNNTPSYNRTCNQKGPYSFKDILRTKINERYEQ